MKRGRKKRRVVVTETYTNPLVYRNVLSLITPHCTMEAFARLKRVCKAFLKWLPEHHPLRDEIVKEYAKEWPRERPELMEILLGSYTRRFFDMIHPCLHYRVLTQFVAGSGTLDDSYIRLDLHTGVVYVREGAISHIFEDRPCAMLEFHGYMDVSLKVFVCGGFKVFRYTENPELERLVSPYAKDEAFMAFYRRGVLMKK
jgi:hypothetical protein